MSEIKHKTILIAGGSGLIGRRLSELLESKSHRVILLTHDKSKTGKHIFYWNPEKNLIDQQAIREADVIINLAGESIAGKRWTAMRKRKIVNSRILSTNLLFEALHSTPNQVELVINASAIGIYGNSGEMIMNENSPLADDFLGVTCKRWENAACQFQRTGVRTVIFRIGVVFAEEGGMLSEIIKPMKFGIAPVFGSGKQYHSWIHIDDLCRIISSAIRNEAINGIYNAVAPGPLSNRNLMILLTHILGGRFLLIRIPKFFIQLILGEMSKVVTEGQRASSKKLESTGFVFKYAQANLALRNLLGK